VTDSIEATVAVLKNQMQNITKSLDEHKTLTAASADKSDKKVDEVSDAVAELSKKLTEFMVKLSVGTGIFCAVFVIIFAIPKMSEILKLITH